MVVLSTLINTVIIHDHYVDRLERWFLHKIVTDREVSRIIRGTEPLETERLESPWRHSVRYTGLFAWRNL